MSLTIEQEQLARAIDSMRLTDETNTKLALALAKATAELALALAKATAERDAYLAHLEQSQAEVARLTERVRELETSPTKAVAQEITEKTETEPQAGLSPSDLR